MKTINFLMAAVLVGLLGCGQSRKPMQGEQSAKGVDVGSGGDQYASEFVDMGYAIADILLKKPGSEISAAEFLAVVKATKVISSENLSLNGKAIDAINYPDATPPRIEMSRQGWDRMRSDGLNERIFLVFHEYLGIMKKDDSRYQISKGPYRIAKVCRPNPLLFHPNTP